jgi:uncharacterized membrane protein
MNGGMDWTLTKRVDALEVGLNDQEGRLRRLEELLEAAPAEQAEQSVVDGDETSESRTVFGEESGSYLATDEEDPVRRGELGLPEWLIGLRSWEWWLNKVGIGLLLFGVAFLFKFSVDQGWLTPVVRVGIGLSIGAVLVGIGLRVYSMRRAFSQVMLGGGIGTFYITGFAAFQLYAMVAYPVAIAFMVAVTLLAFALALRQNGVALALIGSAGGFGTPFVLYTDSGSLSGLVLYTCLVLSGVCAIYLYKGWRSLLLFSTVAVWATFVAGYDNFIVLMEPGLVQGRSSLQIGVLFAWLALWGVSVAREVLRGGNPGRWGFPEPSWMAQRLFGDGERILRNGAVAHLLSVTGPIIALAFTAEIWGLQKASLGWVALGGAALYALVTVALRCTERGGRLSYTHALVALLLITLSLVLVLEGDALFFTLAAEAALLHIVSRRLPDRLLSALGHVLFLVVGTWLAGRLVFGAIESTFFTGDTAFFDVGTWIDFTVIALAFGVSGFVTPAWAKRAYRVAVHAALLGWIWRELAALPESGAYISLAWGIYAVGLLVVGLRMGRAGFIRLGLVTLFVVVGKLFLVDLAWVGAVWRILLFLGFGGVFLALSYYLQSLWRPGRTGGPMRGGA